MKLSPIVLLFSGLCLTTAPDGIEGQTLAHRLSLEPRLGLALPIRDFGDPDPTCQPVPGGGPSCPYPLQTGAEAGWRWSLRAHYTLNSWLGVVGGYGRANFGCPAAFCAGAAEPKAQGWELGFKAVVIPMGTMMGWVEGTGTYETVSIVRTQTPEGERESSLVGYEGAVGVSLGVGAELPLRGKMDLTFVPGFRLRLYDADPPASDSDLAAVRVSYVLVELGIRYIFGRGG